MRFGLINMFPNATVNSSGGTQQYTMNDAQKVDKKAKDGKTVNNDIVNQNTTETISVFSRKDTNTDGKVNYDEAKSIFQRMDISTYSQNFRVTNSKLLNANGDLKDNNALDYITKIANSKFDAGAAFKNIAKGFISNVGSTKITIDSHGQNNKGELEKTAANELDQKVISDVRNAETNFNAKLLDAYNEALVKAENDYANNADIANNIGDNENTSLKGQAGENKVNENGEVKTSKSQTNVYSQYDKNKDKSVTYNEVRGDLISYNNKVSIKPQGDTKMQRAINDAFGGDVAKYAQNQFDAMALAGTNITVEEVTIESKGKDNQDDVNKKIAEKIDKLDKKVKSTAQQLNARFNEQIYSRVNSEVNRAVAEYTLKGKVENTHEETDLSNLQPQKPAEQEPTTRADENAPTNPTPHFGGETSMWAGDSAAADSLINNLVNLFSSTSTGSTTADSDASRAGGSNSAEGASEPGNSPQTANDVFKDCHTAKDVTEKLEEKYTIPSDKKGSFEKDLIANNPRIFKNNGQVYRDADFTKLKLPKYLQQK